MNKKSASLWKMASIRRRDFLSPRLSLREQIFFIKRLAFLTNAGYPVLESLCILRESDSHPYRRIVEGVIHDVENGRPLSQSLRKFPHCFSDFAVHIISVGESSGMLSQNLAHLADELTKKQAL